MNYTSMTKEQLIKELELLQNRLESAGDTDHKQVEKAVLDSERKFRESAELLPQAIFEISLQGKITYTNQHGFDSTGYSQDDIDEGINVAQLIVKEDQDKLKLNITNVLNGAELEPHEYSILRKDGSIYPVIIYSLPIIKEGKPVGLRGVVIDITERKQAENLAIAQKELAVLFCETSNLDDALKLSVEKAIQISGMDSGGIYIINEKTGDLNLKYSVGFGADFVKATSHYNADSQNVQLVNKGRPLHTVIDETGIELNPARKAEKLHAISIVPMIFKGKPIGCMNIASHTKNNIPEYAQHALETIAGQVSGIINRFKIESQLKRSEERYRSLFADDMTGDYISTPEGGLIDCNPAFAKIFGYETVEEALSVKIESFYINPEDRKEFFKKLREKGRLELFEKEFYHRSGKVLSILENAVGVFNNDGKLIEVRGYIIDDTEQKKLKEQFYQAQKMESVGRLAGGIAHDFNNLLTVIVGNADFSKMYVGKEDPLYSNIEEISKAANRAAELTYQLLAFSRKQELQPKIIESINQVVITDFEYHHLLCI
jgi:PAS domain S-box-containing protein